MQSNSKIINQVQDQIEINKLLLLINYKGNCKIYII